MALHHVKWKKKEVLEAGQDRIPSTETGLIRDLGAAPVAIDIDGVADLDLAVLGTGDPHADHIMMIMVPARDILQGTINLLHQVDADQLEIETIQNLADAWVYLD